LTTHTPRTHEFAVGDLAFVAASEHSISHADRCRALGNLKLQSLAICQILIIKKELLRDGWGIEQGRLWRHTLFPMHGLSVGSLLS
jgi:hypothetical protein